MPIINFPPFVRSKYGIRITRCCASCSLYLNTCTKSEKPETAPNQCSAFRLKECLENAGKGDCGVKKLDYMRYHLYRHSLLQGEVDTETLRQNYSADNGSIYEIHPDYQP